jgi:hypothetical protein
MLYFWVRMVKKQYKEKWKEKEQTCILCLVEAVFRKMSLHMQMTFP